METKDEYLPFCLQTIDPKLYAIAPCPPTWYVKSTYFSSKQQHSLLLMYWKLEKVTDKLWTNKNVNQNSKSSTSRDFFPLGTNCEKNTVLKVWKSNARPAHIFHKCVRVGACIVDLVHNFAVEQTLLHTLTFFKLQQSLNFITLISL